MLADLVALNAAKLTKADTRLLDVLMSDPVRAAMDNGSEVSSRAGVHPASAVRLARRLGFDGYPEFRTFIRSSLIDAVGDFENPAARMAARLVKAEQGGILASLLDSEIAALQQVRNSVSDDDIRQFSQCISNSRRIFILGRGHFGSLAALIALRLNRSGYPSIDLGSQMHQFPEAIDQITSGDALLLLAFRRAEPMLNDVRTVAYERGATTMAITDIRGARFEPAPEHHISVSRGAAGESQSLVVPMTVANAIILDLASIDDGKSLRALDSFKAFRASLPTRLPR